MDRIALVIIQQSKEIKSKYFSTTKRSRHRVLLFVLSILTLMSMHTFAQAQDKKSKKKSKENKSELTSEQQERINTLFFSALSQKNQGNEDAAISNLKKVLEIDPNNDAAYYELGIAYSGKNQWTMAEENFDKAASLKPDNEWYLLQKAKAKEKLFKYKDAELIYAQLAKAYPDKISYLFDVASMKLYSNDLKEAIKVYDQIEKQMGINEDIIVQKEKIWLKLGNVDKAADEIERLIQSQPTEPRYRMMLVELYMANNLNDQAFVALEELMKIDENNGFAQLALADYYRSKKDTKKSYEVLKKAFANPSINIDQKVRILSPYFGMLQDSVQLQQALELSEIATKANADEAKAFAIYGDFLYQAQKLKEATIAYEKTLELDKKVFAVWQNLMFIQAEQNAFDALLKTSNEAKELYPSNQIVHYLNAVAKSQLKDYNGAIEAYQQALNLLYNNTDLEAQIYAGLGDAYHSLKNHAKSDASYEQALKLKPNDAYVLNNYAYYLSLRKERLEKALEMSKKSNEIVQKNPSFLDTYAWIYFTMGNYSEALIWIQEAIKYEKEPSPTLAEHLGDIYFKLGKSEEALKEWERAKRLGTKTDVLEKKIKEKKWYDE